MNVVEYIKSAPAKVATWLNPPKTYPIYFHVIELWGVTNYIGEIDFNVWNDDDARSGLMKIMTTTGFNLGWMPEGELFPEDVPFLEFLLGTYNAVLQVKACKSGKKKVKKRGRNLH